MHKDTSLLHPRLGNFTLLGSFADLPEWHFCLCTCVQAFWPINVAYNFVKSRLVWPCCLHNFVKAVWLGNVAYFILIAALRLGNVAYDSDNSLLGLGMSPILILITAFWAWGCRL